MSGICGVYYRDQRPATAGPIEAMLAKMKHRGPDGCRVWLGHIAAFGHCMLYTTPESFHEQLPRTTTDPDLTITADARIDNRTELLASVGLNGPLSAMADSDLILAAYR